MAGKSAVSATVWRKIQHEYQTTKTSCKALALKYGLVPGTVSNRCKLEKWRSVHPRAETKAPATIPLFSSSGDTQASQSARERALREAVGWLDRLEDAYQNERRYDRVEAAQKLIPLWGKVVEQIQKLDAPADNGAHRPLISVHVLNGGELPPLALLPPPNDGGTDTVIEAESIAA